jgi:AcrR family transcriptional regulator
MYDSMLDTIATVVAVDAAPTERLRALVLGLLERIDESPAFFRLAMATQASTNAAGSAAVGGALMLIGLDMMRLMEDLLQAGIASGDFRPDLDPERTVTLLGQQVYGALSVRAGEPDPLSADRTADDICGFVLRGIGA